MEKPITIDTTHGDLQIFLQAAKMFLNQKDLRPSHLSQAISKTIRENRKHFDEYDDAIADKRIDFAQKDKQGVILLNPNGSYQMKADGAKKFQAAVRAIQGKKIKATVFYAKSVPLNLELPWYDAFIPFVIKDYPEPVEEPKEDPKEEGCL